ncbi:uncharacterized protein [Temnothorax longispinosus]|uniref:uncharacterized protein n=1 Tax=Temnothorax longispinosus TaxID=300112 RepID=UPI003A9A3789
MDSVQSRKIKIRYGEKCMNMNVTNNTLKKSVLKDYFPDGGTLTYQIDGETYLLDTDAQSIYVNANVNIYDFNVPKDVPVSQLNGKKRKRFHDILETLYSDKKSDYVKKKLSQQKIVNKKQGNLSLEVENSSLEVDEIENKKTFIKRILHLGWKHRNQLNSRYEYMGATFGPRIKITLNGNEDYPLQKLKDVLLKEYITENNKYYFENSTVEIGTFNETVIESYIHDGKRCDFWNFCKYHLRRKSHMLSLYLLTTKKNTCISSNKEPFEISNKLSCSLSIDKCSKVAYNLSNISESIHKINDIKFEKKSSSGRSSSTSGYTSGLNQISTAKKKDENINIFEKSILLQKSTDYTIETKRKQEKSILEDVTNKTISSQF